MRIRMGDLPLRFSALLMHRTYQEINRFLRQFVACLVVTILSLASPAAQSAMEGYSTVLRVEFVLECMRDRDGTRYEMMNKCSCALDRLGERYSADEFVDAWTTSKAITISGKRGAALRDNDEAKQLARSFRDAVERAEADCFLR